MHLRRTRTFSPTAIKPHRGTTTSKKFVFFSNFKMFETFALALHSFSLRWSGRNGARIYSVHFRFSFSRFQLLIRSESS